MKRAADIISTSATALLLVSIISGAQTWKPPAESVHGIHLLENLKLGELAAKRVYEFAFVMQPLKIQGATGSTVAPIAIR